MLMFVLRYLQSRQINDLFQGIESTNEEKIFDMRRFLWIFKPFGKTCDFL